MTVPARSNSVLRGMLTRRDNKIALLNEQLLQARIIAVDAVSLAKRLRAENKALHHNNAVLQRPDRTAKRNERARLATDVLDSIAPLTDKIRHVLDYYYAETRHPRT